MMNYSLCLDGGHPPGGHLVPLDHVGEAGYEVGGRIWGLGRVGLGRGAEQRQDGAAADFCVNNRDIDD